MQLPEGVERVRAKGRTYYYWNPHRGTAREGERIRLPSADTDPKVFTRIHMHFVVRGRALKPNLVEQAIRLSHDKYCSASIMLGKTAEVTTGFEIVEE